MHERDIAAVAVRALCDDGHDRCEHVLTFPPPVADMLLDAYAAAVGLPAVVTDTVLEVTGVPARSFHDWALDHVGDFTPSTGR